MTAAAGPDRRRLARRAGAVRQVRPAVPVASAVFVVLGWGVVAHNSGAGWVQALGDVVAGTLVIGLLGPAVVLWRTRLAATGAPGDGTAGLPCEIGLTSSSRVRVTPVDPGGPTGFIGPALGGDGAGDTVILVPRHRAVVTAVVVDVATAAPFGLLWWRRRLRIALPGELLVAPRPGAPLALPPEHDDRRGSSATRMPRDIGEPRGVRPYRPGDSRRWVHWPATAHAGEHMVREMEGPRAEPVTVVVDLPGDADGAETTAGQALGTVVALVDRGTEVTLTTTETGGHCTGPVTDRRTAGRRLARAVDGGGERRTGVTLTTGAPERREPWG
ncbi:MAG: DUF58 domain-containing protein [Acidimicrobiales bacterium]